MSTMHTNYAIQLVEMALIDPWYPMAVDFRTRLRPNASTSSLSRLGGLFCAFSFRLFFCQSDGLPRRRFDR
jgi:hypothetical protein